MTIASLLIVLITAIPSSAATSEPVLLDFHAEWCGPCRQMRPAVAQLSRKGYPIKSIDIDQAPDLKHKYGVDAVPTFIVVGPDGRELGRTSGSQPAAQLARFYLDAKAKAQPPANSRAHADGDSGDDADGEADEPDSDRDAATSARSRADQDAGPERDDEKRAEPEFENPKPWETVVRIRVLAQGSVGFGSGTVIHSSQKETLILTCAHIFKLDGQRQAAAERFPRKIMVDLFDGKLHGERPAQVHFVESVEGQAIDYDFTVDVGLIRIRPGRRLPAARVVPAHWEPRSRMKMLTVGCSEGQDATAWHTIIINPQMRGLAGNPSYQAIECLTAPKQGRSGGGLYTTDGYIAGVCNFAEPHGNHGLYATPRSIYGLLDRNNMMALYAPVRGGSGALLASRRDRARGRTDSPITIARGQSPDAHESDRGSVRPGDVTVPDPELLGIKPPLATRRTSGGGEGSTRRMAWHPTHAGTAPVARLSAPDTAGKTEQTDLNIDSEADHDRISHFESDRPAPAAEKKQINPEDIPSAAGSTTEPSPKSRWRPARSGTGNSFSETADH